MKTWEATAYTSIDKKHIFSRCEIEAETLKEARAKALNMDVDERIAKHWNAGAGHTITISVKQ
jgi:hypothetical protein